MPLDAPVTIATLLDSLLIFTIVLDPIPRTPNVHRYELRLARIKISIYAPYAKERFETARQLQFCILNESSPTRKLSTSPATLSCSSFFTQLAAVERAV